MLKQGQIVHIVGVYTRDVNGFARVMVDNVPIYVPHSFVIDPSPTPEEKAAQDALEATIEAGPMKPDPYGSP